MLPLLPPSPVLQDAAAEVSWVGTPCLPGRAEWCGPAQRTVSHLEAGRGSSFPWLLRTRPAFRGCFLRTRLRSWQRTCARGPAGGSYRMHQQPTTQSHWKWQQLPSRDGLSLHSLLPSSSHKHPSDTLSPCCSLNALWTSASTDLPPLCTSAVALLGPCLALLRTAAQRGVPTVLGWLCQLWSFITLQPATSGQVSEVP